MRRINKSKIAGILLSLCLAFSACWFGLGEVLGDSHKPSEYIGLIFSILAASLFAVISIISDPSLILPGNWRGAWEQAKDMQLRVFRFIYIFRLYLVVLGLLVSSEVVKSTMWTSMYFVHDFLAFFAVFAFFLSFFWLPIELADLQRLRLQREISSRRDKS